jgi:hypothetical protein
MATSSMPPCVSAAAITCSMRTGPGPSLEIAGQRLRHTSLTLGNIGGSPTPRNHTAETRLAGWGERIRTSELQKLRPSNSMHTPAPSPASRLATQCPESDRGNAEDARKRAGRSGASGKRIHGAIWHIGEAGAALTHRAARRRFRSRMDTGCTGGVIGGSECGP